MNYQSVSPVKDCEVTVHIAASILIFWVGPLLTEAELKSTPWRAWRGVVYKQASYLMLTGDATAALQSTSLSHIYPKRKKL